MINEVNDLIEYIEDNISDTMSLKLLASKFHYSEFYLSRKFNSLVGMNIKTYINRRKLSRLAIDLKQTTKSIEYLADIYGFTNSKYMSNLFKKEYSVTPREYRNGHMYINITPTRIIRGDNYMKINRVSDLCNTVFNNCNDENELRDVLASIENCEVFSKKDSDIRLIVYIDDESGTYTEIREVKLNILSGNFTNESIFFLPKSKVRIDEMYLENECVMIRFEELKTNKKIVAYVNQGTEAEVIIGSRVFEENVVNSFPLEIETNITKEDFIKRHLEVEEIAKEFLELTNSNEIANKVKADESIIALKSFGSEYILVTLHTENNYYRLDSIYLNMTENRYFNHCFFSTPAEYKNIEIRKVGNECHIFLDTNPHTSHYIINGEELPSSLHIKFPSGMSGNGGWDFSGEFDVK